MPTFSVWFRISPKDGERFPPDQGECQGTTWKTLRGARRGLYRELVDTLCREADAPSVKELVMIAPAKYARPGQIITVPNKSGHPLDHWIEVLDD